MYIANMDQFLSKVSSYECSCDLDTGNAYLYHLLHRDTAALRGAEPASLRMCTSMSKSCAMFN